MGRIARTCSIACVGACWMPSAAVASRTLPVSWSTGWSLRRSWRCGPPGGPSRSGDLIEFLLAIPPEQKFAPHPESDALYAGSKSLVRRAMRGIVPESIVGRTTKTRFRAVFQNEIARTWPVYEAAFGPDSRPKIAERGYIDREAFWSRLQQMREGAMGPLELAYVKQIVWLETWLWGLRQPRPDLVTVRPQHAECASPRPIDGPDTGALLSQTLGRTYAATASTAISGRPNAT